MPLDVTPGDERVLAVRLHAARQIYSAALGDGLRRLDRLRQRKAWQSTLRESPGKHRTEALNALRAEFELTDCALQTLARIHWRAGGFTDRLDTQVVQKLGTRP